LKQFNLRTRIFITMSLALAGGVVACWSFLGAMAGQVLEGELAASLERGRTTQGLYLDARANRASRRAAELARSPHVREALEGFAGQERGDPAIASLLGGLPTMEGMRIWVADASGRVLHGDPDVDSISRMPGIEATSGPEGDEVWSGVWREAGEISRVTVRPVRSRGRFLGHVVVGDSFDQALANELFAITGEDVLIADSDTVVGWCSSLDAGEQSPGSELPDRAGRSVAEVVDAEAGDGTRRVMTMEIDASGLRILLSRSITPSQIVTSGLRGDVLVLVLALLVLSFVVSRSIARRMTSSLHELTDAARLFVDTSFVHRTPVAGDREVVMLAAAMNEMAELTQEQLESACEHVQLVEGANADQSHFLDAMSHELRTPLNAMLGFASLIEERSKDEATREHIVTVRECGEALLSLIEDMLDAARLGSSPETLEVGRFELQLVLETAIAPQERLARSRELTIEVELGDDVPAELVGSGPALRRVLRHLLSHAIRLSRCGVVSVAVTRLEVEEGERLRFEVHDVGQGSSRRQGDQPFHSFQGGEADHPRANGGSGLGLWLARKLVLGMQGAAGVESDEEAGATLWFELPFGSIEIEPPAALPSRASLPARGSQARVLIVEDNKVNQRFVLHVLENSGVHCELASNGEEALERLGSVRFDVVLMDCRMPVMDGLEATRRIRQVEATSGVGAQRLPVIALTASTTPSDRMACYQAGMDEFLSKPFDPAELLEVVQRWTERARATT